MKQREIKKCAACDQGMMHSGQITFYHVRLRHMVVNLPAVQRQSGLEQMLGPCAFVAQHIGPDEDLAQQLSEFEVLVCMKCAGRYPLAELGEQIANRDEKAVHHTTHQKD